MNEIEFMLGDMLNDEKRRVIYLPLVDLTKISDPDLVIIAQVLLEEKPFDYFDLYKRFGKEITSKAMDLANQAEISKQKRKDKK